MTLKKCIVVQVYGKVQGVGYRSFVQKEATALGIEGTIKNNPDGSVIIHACASSELLEAFIDIVYKGSKQSAVTEVVQKPVISEKSLFRGVFRIIGEE